MRVEIHRGESSRPIVIEDAVTAYTKGPLYCVLVEKEGKSTVYKYPLCSIFRVAEDY